MPRRRTATGFRAEPQPRRSFHPAVERVEARVLLTDFTVTNTGDSPRDTGALRYALTHAAAGDRVLFDIPTSDPNYQAATGSWTILVASPLPAVFSPSILIDGLSQQSRPGASTTHPAIELAPSSSFPGSGLDLESGGVTVRGLAIDGFQGAGISVGSGASGELVTGNFIGTDVTGMAPRPNGGGGLLIISSGNTIGGPTSADRNVVSGNAGSGIVINAGGSANLVEGNFIGTNAAGTSALGNSLSGITLQQTSGNTISGNVLSGNGVGPSGGSGISLADSRVQNNLIQKNLIGTDLLGIAAVPNNGAGVSLFGPSNTLADNVISGNLAEGIFGTSSGNTFQGNLIGTNAAGTSALGNGLSGITLQGSSGNTIRGNVLSGNGVRPIGGNGLTLVGSGAQGNLVQGNFIGTDAAGTVALPNLSDGVNIRGPGNTIGGDAAGEGNVISGNHFNGISIVLGLTAGNQILGNRIGTDASGTEAIGNGSSGITLQSAATTIRGNVISGNGTGPFGGSGLSLQGSGAQGNLVQGNFIGTDAAGALALPNHGTGVLISGANNSIGGTTAGAGNTIAFNAGTGVVVDTATGNAILSNSIFDNGGVGIALRNGGNNNQIAPVLTDAILSPDQTVVDGTLAVRAGIGYLVQYYGNNPPSGQGRMLLGSQTIGPQSANATVPLSFTTTTALPLGSTFTAIASVLSTPTESIDPALGDTSAFSNAVTLVSPFVVTNTQDFGIGSLRFAVQAANADLAHDDTITFRIPTSDPGFSAATGSWTIPVLSGLTIAKPTLRGVQHTVFIDGLSQQSQPGASTTHPVIVITPGGDFSGSDGLTIASAGNTVGGLVIHGFPGNGLVIGSGASRNLVTGSFIGTDPLGTAAVGNGGAGIAISGPNNTVGGAAAGARNVLSGNQTYGVSISGTSGNAILGNDIGAGADGATAVGNVLDGIFLDNALGSTISGNVLSANGVGQDAAGINMTGSGSTGNLISNNQIGTDAKGTAALGNSLHGVFIGDGASNNTIGPGNVISGNGLASNQGVGVYLFGNTTTGNLVVGNPIGTDATGASRLTETVIGVLISQAPGNTVRGNLISGNRFVGLEIAGATASGNQVLGNRIGTNAAGTRAIPNGFDGVYINDAPNNTIGGTAAGAGNLISGNGSVGIQLFGPNARGNVVVGNAIGLDSAGRLTLPNRNGGIFVNTGPQANQIGATAPGGSNAGQKQPRFSLSGFHQAHRAGRARARSHAARPKAVSRPGTRPSLRPLPHWPITGGVVKAAALAAPLPKGILSIKANSPLNGKGPVTGRT